MLYATPRARTVSRREKVLMTTSLVAAAACVATLPARAQNTERQTISLDGIWEVADSVSPTDRPAKFDHRAPVPALTHSSTPAFTNVGEFHSLEYEAIKGLAGLPSNLASIKGAGNPGQTRNYFWYRTSFNAPSARVTARLKVNKAQFGSEVWVNGVRVGINDSCFTAGHYDITKAIQWSEKNEVVIRIGAHPGVLPPGNTCVFDFEKRRWTPGIWDSVSVYFNDGASITSMQVAPRIDSLEAIVQTQLKNPTSAAVRFNLVQSVRGLKDGAVIARSSQHITLAAGEERTVTETISLPDAKLWSQEAPNLYVLDTSTGGDSASTRFGMREFRFDTISKRAYLNGKTIFLRGGNIALHRFFDDELSGTLPWEEVWVRKLLGSIPRKMHWNTVKFTIGPVPEKWLDIADEEGLLVLYEFPIWTLTPSILPGYSKIYDTATLRQEYEDWLRDNWNHPSIVYWSASLESKLPEEQAGMMIESIRKLDLSNRAWGNSWNPPQGPDDPSEYKQYKFASAMRGPSFDMTQLEAGTGAERMFLDTPSGHAGIITEYDWLWLNRDGSPTVWSQKTWEKMPYPNATAEERHKTQAYLLAGLTEYWRAYRNYAGVIYLAYLSISDGQGWVADYFSDVKNLTFNPYFGGYVFESFKPLGVYVNFWQHALELGSHRDFEVMMVNDEGVPSKGTISLVLEDNGGKTLAKASRPYDVAAYGQHTQVLSLDMPNIEGEVTLKAIATPSEGPTKDTTTSHRFFKLLAKGSLPQRRNAPTERDDPGGQFESKIP